MTLKTELKKAFLIKATESLNKSEGSPDVRRWNNIQNRYVGSAHNEANIANPVQAAMHKDNDFKFSWHPQHGHALIGHIQSMHSDTIHNHDKNNHFDEWVRGAYLKDKNEIHTRAWANMRDHPQYPYVEMDENVWARSDEMQEKSVEAMKNSGHVPKDAVHIKDSNNEKAQGRLK